MAGFRVDLREHAVGRQKIVPGDPDESPLIKRLITAEDAERMPPLKSDNPQPSNEQLELIKRWIKEAGLWVVEHAVEFGGNVNDRVQHFDHIVVFRWRRYDLECVRRI